MAEEAESSLTGQGLVLDTFQLQDIQAEGSYLQDLGRPEAARVIKEASIAEAKARQAAEQEKLLAEEANRVRAQVHIADGDAPADDGIGSADDLEDDFDDDDLVYESPLESVPVYEPFSAVIRQLQTQQADLFQSLTASLNEQQQQDLQQVYDLQDSEDTGTSA